ncbi:transferring glycosyl group transferase [Senna tora]|uniref:Transferring glycosyl group transferase n=1 Tax=Senna tora TaxID=362788 RepID=A0A835CMD2_9FABA|nr:transferring glycosyl group transferase [Senna tora]
MGQVEAVEKLVGAYKSDPGRIVQHTFCHDLRRNWSVSVAWGYSVQLYPWLSTAKELDTAFRTFQTWRSRVEEPFSFNTRPMSNDPCERPLVFFLDRIENMGGGETRSTYTRDVEDSDKRCDRVDYVAALGMRLVNVSASHFIPELWKKAPRRQCCEHYTANATLAGEEPTNISHVVFGIAGSAKTWPKRHPYVELYWRPNVTRGFVWLDEKPPQNVTWPDTSPPYKVSADTSSFNYTCWYGNRSAIRLTRIVKETFQLGLENVRWFVMGDDDTLFFPDNLVTVLAKYDHNDLYYIGDQSESVEQDVIHSYNTAFGGGGYAISYPLAAHLVNILDGCINRYAQLYGADQKVQACVSEIGVQTTRELGFHQLDIQGSAYGFLAAHPVAPLVSLHHLEAVDQLFPSSTRLDSLKKLVNAYKMDPGRVLQHSFCYDLQRNWSVSVSWGYSVELYPTLLTAKVLETALGTFQTWKSWSDQPFVFNIRPVSSDPCGRPVVYFLDRVESVGEGETRSTYARYGDVLEKKCGREDYRATSGIDFVNVTASKFTPDMWKKAPRRQCCDIMNGSDGVKNVVQIKIRECHRFESVTPP